MAWYKNQCVESKVDGSLYGFVFFNAGEEHAIRVMRGEIEMSWFYVKLNNTERVLFR